MEGTYSLRPATPDDAQLLAEIERRVHVSPWTADHFQTEFGKDYSRTLLLTDDETDSHILGYVVFWHLMGQAQILNVAVDLPYRGLGFGKQLVRAALGQARRGGDTQALLEVRKGNQAAIQLYQKMGFHISHVRKAFYSNGEDAYVMELQFSEEASGEAAAF